MLSSIFHRRPLESVRLLLAIAVITGCASLPSSAAADPDSAMPDVPDSVSLEFPAALLEPPPAGEQPAAGDQQPHPPSELPVQAPELGHQPAPPTGDRCTIRGTEGSDRLAGTPAADVICGAGGNDRLDGRGGNDTIIGGTGRDRMTGGAGRDRLAARDGARDSVTGGAGRDRAATDPRLDRVRSVESAITKDARVASFGQLYTPSEVSCRDRRNYSGLPWSDVTVESNALYVAAHGGGSYGHYEWVRVQDFLFGWNGSGWTHADSDTAVFAKVTGGGRISDWMLANGQTVSLGWSRTVTPGYWAVAQNVVWYDAQGRQIDRSYDWLDRTTWSQGAGGGDGFLNENWYCGLG